MCIKSSVYVRSCTFATKVRVKKSGDGYFFTIFYFVTQSDRVGVNRTFVVLVEADLDLTFF